MLQFPSGFEVIKPSQIPEEERFEEFKEGNYYPVNIGDILVSNRFSASWASEPLPQYGLLVSSSKPSSLKSF